MPEAPPSEEEEQEAWVNALLGRIFWDFLGEKYWSDVVSKKIQMKLSKIKVSVFTREVSDPPPRPFWMFCPLRSQVKTHLDLSVPMHI